MALPLILGLGAGVLGAGRYLMNKEDNRQAANTRAGLESFLASSAIPQPVQFGLLNRINTIGQNDNMLNLDQNEKMQSMLDFAMQADASYRQRAVDAQRAAAVRGENRAFELSGQMDQAYQRQLSDFATLQDTYRKGITALEANDPANVLASTFNFFNLVEPGGIVRDSESGQYRAVGGIPAEAVNAMNKILGKGLDDETRRQLQGAMQNQFMARKVRADKQREGFKQRRDEYARAGYQFPNPEGRLGIDWNLGLENFNPQQAAPPQPPAVQLPPEKVKQLEALGIDPQLEAQANARGRTLINPNPRPLPGERRRAARGGR